MIQLSTQPPTGVIPGVRAAGFPLGTTSDFALALADLAGAPGVVALPPTPPGGIAGVTTMPIATRQAIADGGKDLPIDGLVVMFEAPPVALPTDDDDAIVAPETVTGDVPTATPPPVGDQPSAPVPTPVTDAPVPRKIAAARASRIAVAAVAVAPADVLADANPLYPVTPRSKGKGAVVDDGVSPSINRPSVPIAVPDVPAPDAPPLVPTPMIDPPAVAVTPATTEPPVGPHVVAGTPPPGVVIGPSAPVSVTPSEAATPAIAESLLPAASPKDQAPARIEISRFRATSLTVSADPTLRGIATPAVSPAPVITVPAGISATPVPGGKSVSVSMASAAAAVPPAVVPAITVDTAETIAVPGAAVKRASAARPIDAAPATAPTPIRAATLTDEQIRVAPVVPGAIPVSISVDPANPATMPIRAATLTDEQIRVAPVAPGTILASIPADPAATVLPPRTAAIVDRALVEPAKVAPVAPVTVVPNVLRPIIAPTPVPVSAGDMPLPAAAIAKPAVDPTRPAEVTAPTPVAVTVVALPATPPAPPPLQPAAQAFAAAMFAAAQPVDDRADTATDDLPFGLVTAAAPTALHTPTLAVQGVAPGQQPALDMARDDWMASMIDRIETLRDESGGVRETRMRLAPEALGSVEVSVRRDEAGVMQVRIAADTPQARALLADAAPKLAEMAEARGVKLGGSSVDSNAGSADQGRRDSQAPASVQRRPATAATDTTDTTTDSRLA